MKSSSKVILLLGVFLAFGLIIAGYAILANATSMHEPDTSIQAGFHENNPLGDMLIYKPDVQALRDQWVLDR